MRPRPGIGAFERSCLATYGVGDAVRTVSIGLSSANARAMQRRAPRVGSGERRIRCARAPVTPPRSGFV